MRILLVVLSALTLTGLLPASIWAGGSNQPQLTLITHDPANTPHNEVKAGSLIYLSVDIYNPTSQTLAFDGTLWHGGSAWSGEDLPYTVWTGEVYWLFCQYGCRHWWRGTVQPYQNARFTIPTVVGNTLGTFDFAQAEFTVAGETLSASKSLTVLDNGPVITSVAPTTVRPGEWVTIRGENFLLWKTDVSSLAILLGNYGFLASVTPRWSSNQQISWNETEIRFRVPDGVPDKTGPLYVIVNNRFARWEGFNIQSASPTATTIPSPTSSPTATPQPTATQQPTATPSPTATSVPTSPPTVRPTATRPRRPVTKTSLSARPVWEKNASQSVSVRITSDKPTPLSYWLETDCPITSSTASKLQGTSNPKKTQTNKAFSVRVPRNAAKGECSFTLQGNLEDGTSLPPATAAVRIR